MTTGEFHVGFTSSIIIPEDRQRRDLGDVSELADSIRRLGLIHPILVTRDLVLVAGHRRLMACKELGWANIPYQFTDEVDETELQALELEENVKRKSLTWQEECDAIKRFHELRKSMDPDWSTYSSAEALGMSQTAVSHAISIVKEIESGNERVATAPKYSTALGIVKRAKEREAAAEVAQADRAMTKPKDAEIIHADFVSWAKTYDGPPFNFIHCDFPYGIEADKFNQGGAATHGGYDDSEKTYFALIDALLDAIELRNLAGGSCHLLFWFSMKHYERTRERLARSFRINPMPLIWHRSDNSGILPDPQRGPRQIYETAFLGARGDRKIVAAVSNLIAHPSEKDIHMSIKPAGMLSHFFRMLVDKTSRVLDPTCGSGAAVRAARSAGAAYALGLEINPEFATLAQTALAKELAHAA